MLELNLATHEVIALTSLLERVAYPEQHQRMQEGARGLAFRVAEVPPEIRGHALELLLAIQGGYRTEREGGTKP